MAYVLQEIYAISFEQCYSFKVSTQIWHMLLLNRFYAVPL
jgi:hypothetical protein